MKKFFAPFFLGLALLLPAFAWASTAQQVVQSTVDQMLGELNTRRDEFKQDPEQFYQSLNTILSPVTDFPGIARGVMTAKFIGRASNEQMQRFEETFKRSLVQFYGNALLAYNNQAIRVLPGNGRDTAQRASVDMEVQGDNGALYKVSYTMVADGAQWKLRNVIIEGINVGKLFRDQFADSMRRNNNNLDKVIDSWADTVSRARQSAEAKQ
ncbi:MlaC/ttg2D family ABC transporter substrate-binding protein [Atopomonas sediminilitoris]|uniref:MlaC/ttg2D family ABC transporter substrate-binding protein n=1 Tax=Atopomonas sediminilitoris TaxID=2919919 RepID=UPI001F4D6F76|nr:ABC transporter substrate-binding protein [Atopomonas sediminilitoris]MCJ8169957.1 ABC transporter substrate-binding protein [Atopomonas sediminilitoris]